MEKVWDDIVNELNGSCESLFQVLETYNKPELEDNMDFLRYLDDHIFLCDGCGWWSPISEAVDVPSGLNCANCEDDEGYE